MGGNGLVYTVEEITVPNGYTASVNGLTITNKHTPSVISISGAKTWVDGNNQDGVRPESITIHLKANGVTIETRTITAADNWAWTFENLPEFEAGKRITYTVTEDAVEDYSTVFNNGTYPRLKDSLRDRKNDLVILKTLLRKSAESGGVHPMHLHRLSTHYAGMIENARTIRQSISLQESMIRDYCLLVKRHSLSKYSHNVAKAITLIQYDLTADLGLKTIAQKLNVNSSYLSTLFRTECGCTLTEYVTRERIDRGIYLL